MYLTHLPTTLLLLSTTLLASASAASTLHTSTIYHHPFSASTPTPLATLSFDPQNPHLSIFESFKAPKSSKTDGDTTRIAVSLPGPADSKFRYRSTLVDFPSLKEGRGRFRVSVTEEGELVGVAWHPTLSTQTPERREAGRKEGGRGDFDMLVMREGPRAMVDRNLPAAKGKKKVQKEGEGAEVEGEGEEEVEKTFLQKYWYLLLILAFLVMTGGAGGEEKK